jgi:hypothetical protein
MGVSRRCRLADNNPDQTVDDARADSQLVGDATIDLKAEIKCRVGYSPTARVPTGARLQNAVRAVDSRAILKAPHLQSV